MLGLPNDNVSRPDRLRALLSAETPSAWGYHVDESPVALMLLSREGQVLDANPAAGRLFNCSPDALTGKGLRALSGAMTRQLLTHGPMAWRAISVRHGAGITRMLVASCAAQPGDTIPEGAVWLHLIEQPVERS